MVHEKFNTRGIEGVFHGKPLFIDATCISPVRGTGEAMPNAANQNGACLRKKDAETRNQDYPDVANSVHAQLLSLSVETYGRWGQDCIKLVRQLAASKASQYPAILEKSISMQDVQSALDLLSNLVPEWTRDQVHNRRCKTNLPPPLSKPH